MFPNQIPNFLPNHSAAPFNPGVGPARAENQPRVVPAVQIADIYQAAKNRAVEEHELDKLFNPDFYGEGI